MFKKILFSYCVLFSSCCFTLNILASELNYENAAKNSVFNFILAVNNNSNDINIESNWLNLKNKIKDLTTEEFSSSFLNADSKDSFNASLINVISLSGYAMTLVRLGTSSMKILNSVMKDNNKFELKVSPYSLADFNANKLFLTICEEKAITKWWGSKSIEVRCKVSGIENSLR